ncbi:hypothetical protein BYT27DRAFT_7193048, partial [Phlegmacium glaucopus]
LVRNEFRSEIQKLEDLPRRSVAKGDLSGVHSSVPSMRVPLRPRLRQLKDMLLSNIFLSYTCNTFDTNIASL